MKVWMKDKRYKIGEDKRGFVVYFENEIIGFGIKEEEQARKCIWRHIGMKEYVNKNDFENWGDNQFIYPQRVENAN